MQSAAWVAALATRGWAQEHENKNVGDLILPFEFAAGRGSILIHVRVDNRPAVLILDTGSSHTILKPSAIGLSRSDLASPRTGGGVIGDAVGREVTLEIGQRRWHRRRIAVMDLSQALSAYKERIDGLLGIDLLLEFSQAVIDFKNRRVTLVA